MLGGNDKHNILQWFRTSNGCKKFYCRDHWLKKKTFKRFTFASEEPRCK